MSMEMTFLVTGLVVLAVGAGLGLVTYWIFERDDKEE